MEAEISASYEGDNGGSDRQLDMASRLELAQPVKSCGAEATLMRVPLGWSSNFATSRASCPSRTLTSEPWPPYRAGLRDGARVGRLAEVSCTTSKWPSRHPRRVLLTSMARVALSVFPCEGWSDWSVAAQCEAWHGSGWQEFLRVVLVSAWRLLLHSRPESWLLSCRGCWMFPRPLVSA